MTQYSHKSNNTTLAHTTRRSTSSSLRATWLTVFSRAWTVPAVDNAQSTYAERALMLPQIHQCRRSLPSTSVDDLRRRYWTVHLRRAFPHASSDHQCTTISRDVLCEISAEVPRPPPRYSDLHRGDPTSNEVHLSLNQSISQFLRWPK